MAGLGRRLGWCVAGYAALAWLPLAVSEYHTHVFTIALYYVIVAVGWNLLAGYAGQFSLAQHTFAGIGAYGSALLCLYAGVPILVGIVAGAGLAAVVGYGLGTLCLPASLHISPQRDLKVHVDNGFAGETGLYRRYCNSRQAFPYKA